MIAYFFQTIAFQLFFLMIYDIFLKKETFFNWNRVYLLLTSISSLVLPFIKIDRFSEVIPQEYVVNLPQVVIGKLSLQNSETAGLKESLIEQSSILSWDLFLYLGMMVASIVLLYKMTKLVLLIQKNPKRWKQNLLIVKLLNSTSAFSFFHYIFLGEHIEAQERLAILRHEQVHVEQKHTLDLLFFEVLKIVFWFNPLVYMYQKRMTELHEFIADARAVKFQNKHDYYENLLSQVFETQNLSFINPFFKRSLIKKRITMLSKHPSKQKQLLKYTLLVPMVLGMLIYTSTSAQQTQSIELEDKELYHALTEELKEMEQQEATPYEIIHAFSPYFDGIEPTKEEYYRAYIYKEHSIKEFIEIMKRQGVSESKIAKAKASFGYQRNYRDFLAYMKTTEGLIEWQNRSNLGVIKQLVDDMNDLTDEEQARFAENENFVYNDKFLDWYKLVLTDGKSTKVFENSKKREQIAKGVPDISSGKLEVPFALIEQVPIFPGCEGLSPIEQKDCMTKKISEHVNSNFNTKLGDSLGMVGRVKIHTIFKVSKEGKVEGIRVRAPHSVLEKEAIRVISGLPDMIPGLHLGKPVKVPYSLPIVFEVSGKQVVSHSSPKIPSLEDVDVSIEVPFAIVEEPPIYPGCGNGNSNQQKDCMSRRISEFVQKNFNIKLANDLGLVGQQKMNVVFKIDEQGNISGIRARTPHPNLEKEVLRVISGLPQMKPGRQKGKVVTVPYSLPIIFEVKADKKSNDKN